MKKSRGNRREIWIKHYSSGHKILLVGEGDFSFSACLARAFQSATNIVATSLDSKNTLIGKYSHANENLKLLKGLGCTVLHQVDVHTMNQHPIISRIKFDRIVFNFPHAGLPYARESSLAQIRLHQNVVKGFFRSAREMLTKKGEIHVTHKTSHPFSNWDVVELGEEVGLCLVEEVEFYKWEYPGYYNKKGYGPNTNRSFPVGCCSTFKFVPTYQMLKRITIS